MKKRKPIIKERGKTPDFSQPQVRKKGNRSIIKLVYFLLSIIIIVSILSFLFTYEGFNIRSYEITGTKFSNKKNIESFAEQYKNKNIFLMNKLSLIYSCKKINEIHSVKIKKKLPNKIIINIIEEKPICCFNTPKGKFLFNNDGYCFHKLKDTESCLNVPSILSKNSNIYQNSNIQELSLKENIFICENEKNKYFVNSEYIPFEIVKKSDNIDNINILTTTDKIKIGKKYEQKEYLYISPSNKYLIMEGICKPYIYKKEYEKLPKIKSKKEIRVGENFNIFNNYQTDFLYNLGKTVYNNNLNIATIYIKNDCEVILLTKNNILIEFGPTADILDKCYLLKQIYTEKSDILDKINNIYIINSDTATYKLKNQINENNTETENNL